MLNIGRMSDKTSSDKVQVSSSEHGDPARHEYRWLYVQRQMAIERCASAEAAEAPSPVRVITLNHGEHQDSTLYRFEKGCHLQFCPGPSLLGKKVSLYTNHVSEEAAEFVRNQYSALEWRRDAFAEESLGAGALITDTDLYCELRLQRAGSFHYYFVYDNTESAAGPQGSGWFQTSPTVRAGGVAVPLDGLMCQTVLAKCLGPLERWQRVLRVAHECGYNMVHFSPVQRLGGSDSGYSIADHLRPNPIFGDVTFADVRRVVGEVREQWGLASICDVVLNHTANETPWLAEHPDATYNCANCPHLRPAALLDAALARFGADVALGRYAARGAPPRVAEDSHLEAMRRLLLDEVLPELRLHELFICDVDRLVQDFLRLARNKVPAMGEGEKGEKGDGDEGLKLVTDEQHRRLQASVDLERALRLFNVHRAECRDEEARLAAAAAELRRDLHRLNAAASDELREHFRAAVDNCLAGVRYERLQPDGPRLADISDTTPLVPLYFTGVRADGSAADAETFVFGADGRLCMAHNGWVMNADPLQDFAAREHRGRVYLRRELIAWGDSVKLRYGDGPEDSPFLWAHMGRYVSLTAEMFDGLRLDNCHSTPLHVAEHMLDLARNVKSDLYVVAELFTNSDHVDNIFVNRLGITSLVREALSAWDSYEQGRLVHRFGGRAAGAFLRPRRRAARPAVARAMLLDLTHDNPSPLEKRCVFDVLPSAALVAMACCATGSTRGYDELVPHHVHVVAERRLYAEWGEGEGEGRVSATSALVSAKRALNRLHLQLSAEGYSEVFVDQMDADVVAVTRHAPHSRRSVVLVARTAFGAPDAACGGRSLRPLRFEGQLDEILLEAGIVHKDHRVTGQPYRQPGEFARHPELINGLTEYEASVRTGVPLANSAVFREMRVEGVHTVLEFRPLAPGAVVAVRVSPRPEAAAALARLTALTDALHRAPADADPLELAPALADLEPADFNRLLYQCDAEERDCGGGGVYDVPGHGPLLYAGVQGVASLLDEVTPTDDLGHPLCANLRAGDWLVEYAWKRLEAQPRLAAVARRYRELFRPLADAPRFLVPAYYAALIAGVHAALLRAALARAPAWVRADSFARALALTAVQLAGAVPSASLPPPAPPNACTLSAGLPHFAVGYMRCWGRDTFIALRGTFLLTGRFAEARDHILAFGACLRHGLIPNLLDSGRNARYNCRDAVWWWLNSVERYCAEAPEGLALLTAPVKRLFPRDDSPSPAECPLHDLMQEALDVHFQGLVFRERNAGRAIDAHMTDKGFNVQIGVDPDTGFPFGGNDANCGTWMDKMGSSDAAGNRGRPATPRDGSAVELVALAHRCAVWLAAQHRAARYPYPGVARRHRDGSLTAWTFAEWAERIRSSFERHFWVPTAPSAADSRPDLVHRRGIYKDSHGASQPWADYQLRCNFPLAMAVSPDLFDPKHAWRALDVVERVLLGPLGIKTLDPADWAYRPDYHNSNDSTDPSVAHGFNYHQGPEWLWPVGFYLRARLAFAHDNGRLTRTVADVLAAMAPHHAEIRDSPWRGLPELTNAGGAFCADSCRTQAWSSAVMLEVLHDLNRARRARPLLPAD